MKKVVEPSVDELLGTFATDFKTFINQKLATKPEVEVVLTGGTLGIKVLENIKELDLPWERISFQFGDERFVDLNDADRNEFQALSVWPELKHLRFHQFPNAGSDLEAAGRDFDKSFSGRFGDVTSPTREFDLVILGMGPDGHVASLFPGHSYENDWVVSESDSPKPPSKRLSLSYAALNNASEVWFLAAGKEKSDAVRCGQSDNCDLPVGKVRGRSDTRWYLDGELNDAL